MTDEETIIAMKQHLASMRKKAAAAAEAGDDTREFEFEANRLQLLLDLMSPNHASVDVPGGPSN